MSEEKRFEDRCKDDPHSLRRGPVVATEKVPAAEQPTQSSKNESIEEDKQKREVAEKKTQIEKVIAFNRLNGLRSSLQLLADVY